MKAFFENRTESIYVAYYDSSHHFPPHFQNKFEIAHCFSGAQDVRIGKEIFTLKKGDTVFIAPNVLHEYIETSPQDTVKTEVLCIMSDTEFFDSLIPGLASKRPASPFVPSQRIKSDTLNAFYKMTNKEIDSIELLGWCCIALSGLISNLTFEKNIQNTSDIVPKLIEYVNNNFKENLTIKSVAAALGYSPSYIAHVFFDRLQLPFRTYLGTIRSEYAKELILKGEKNLTEIAYECGYTSLNTFCRCFKKHFGKTPSELKKQAEPAPTKRA